MWKYQQKEHKKYKGSLSTWRITSKPEPVINLMLIKKTCISTCFDCAHELINGESGILGEAGKILKN